MSASLVGSEMCIRDRRSSQGRVLCRTARAPSRHRTPRFPSRAGTQGCVCLLYTSDAADDM
eukprot:10043237-Alexandrium_andersonii.AAC.1